MADHGEFMFNSNCVSNRNFYPSPLLKAEDSNMTNWTNIDGKKDCEEHLSSAIPPDALDVGISLSEKVIGFIFHDKLRHLSLHKPSWAQNRDTRKKNRMSRLRRLLRRKLFSSQNLVQLRFIFNGCQEIYWYKFGRLFHCLPSIESLSWINYDTTYISAGFLYDLMMIPKNLKLLSLTTNFDPYLAAACFSRRISCCLDLGLFEICPVSSVVLSRFVRHLLRYGTRNQIIRQTKLKYDKYISNIQRLIVEACYKFLEGEISFPVNASLRSIACIVG